PTMWWLTSIASLQESPNLMDAAVTFHIAAASADLSALASALRGTVLRPTDEAYEEDRQVWNAAAQGSPMGIVRVADAGDVAATIGFACRNGFEIAVRSGGHSLAGHSTGDEVLVIDMRDLRGMHVDLAEETVWAGAGLTAGEVTAALAEHGRAVPFGDTGSVGIAGLTLGGGIGWLARKFGLTIDSLLAVEIVTANGEVLTASETERPDLFWALRGGGGNFGVVTRFQYRMSPVGEVLGGALFLPPTRDVLRGLVPIAGSAPEELTTISMLMPIPPVPFVPEEHHGKPSLVVMFVYAGDPADGQRAIAPFLEVAEPYGVAAMPMPYPGIYEFTKEAGERHASTTRSVFMDVLDNASIDAILESVERAPEAFMIQLRVFGGAMSHVPAGATAFAHRAATVQVTVIAPFTDPATVDAAVAWNRSLFAALEPKASGVYANFLEDEGESRVRTAYPGETYERLARVKRRYDRFNVFHRNQNIRPARA
ncbi:MAG TPA: FAD-binding oxidoreductase, partial [Candidatus Limnocylindria bacterium]|nr:FAD-binding oxidoreductase [Candidatus Limnocylindria bacterium]